MDQFSKDFAYSMENEEKGWDWGGEWWKNFLPSNGGPKNKPASNIIF